MSGARGTRLWELVAAQAGGQPITVGHVCAAVTSAAGVDTAAVAILLPRATSPPTSSRTASGSAPTNPTSLYAAWMRRPGSS
jgi:hypothetical protein